MQKKNQLVQLHHDAGMVAAGDATELICAAGGCFESARDAPAVIVRTSFV